MFHINEHARFQILSNTFSHISCNSIYEFLEDDLKTMVHFSFMFLNIKIEVHGNISVLKSVLLKTKNLESSGFSIQNLMAYTRSNLHRILIERSTSIPVFCPPLLNGRVLEEVKLHSNHISKY